MSIRPDAESRSPSYGPTEPTELGEPAEPGEGADRGEGAVHLTRHGSVAHITFDRPAARNSMTMAMYRELDGHVRALADSGTERIRTVVLRGAGGHFVAGTDIAHFQNFRGADDGVAYERFMEGVIGRLEALPIPTLAVVEGAAAGGGLLLAAVCDLRVCTPDARFGMPIARTMGHCLSVANHARLIAHLGPARTKNLILMARFIKSDEALSCGFVQRVVAPYAVDDLVKGICRRLAEQAPITLRVTKEAVRRVVAADGTRPDEGEDLLREAYGSEDFKRGVRAFLDKERPQWEGS